MYRGALAAADVASNSTLSTAAMCLSLPECLSLHFYGFIGIYDIDSLLGIYDLSETFDKDTIDFYNGAFTSISPSLDRIALSENCLDEEMPCLCRAWLRLHAPHEAAEAEISRNGSNREESRTCKGCRE